jgi:hypothetical protein
MAACAVCNKTILFGGERQGDLRFCSKRCAAAGQRFQLAATIPDEQVRGEADAIRRGPCPRCARRNGPVDLHLSHRVYSVIVMTRWSTTPIVSCRPCANGRRALDVLFSLAFGWWGFPWGFLITPMQVFRNIAALLTPEKALTAPSPALERAVRMQLAARLQSPPELPRQARA